MPLRPITSVLAAALIATASSGCGGATSSTTTPRPVVAPAILEVAARPTSFAGARTLVLGLYRRHPAIRRFQVRDVEYTPLTRDKVLNVCHVGGPETSARALESARVLACAPMIFFLYSYGRAARVPDAVNAARKLYWYAVSSSRHPYDAGPGLKSLLRSWGVD